MAIRLVGRLRAVQARNGRPLGLMHLLIASHALSEGCVILSVDHAA